MEVRKNIFDYWRCEIYCIITIIIMTLDIFKLQDKNTSILSVKLPLTLRLKNKKGSIPHLCKYTLARFLSRITKYI